MPSSHSISIELQGIETAQDFHDVLKLLSPEQRKGFFTAMSPFDFLNVFLWLSPEQLEDENFRTLFGDLKERLLNMLEDVNDFQNVFPILLSPRQCTSVCMIVNDSRPQLIKNTKDFKTILKLFRDDDNKWRIAVCQGMQQRLSQVIELNDLLQYFPDSSKEVIRRVFFVSLLQEIKVQSFQFNGDGDVKARKAVDKLYRALEGASTIYFNIEDPAQENYDDFKNSCITAIDEIRKDLKDYRDWKDFFATLVLTIVSFGVIPAVLSVNNKLKTGTWVFPLFKKPVETKCDGVVEVVNQLGKRIIETNVDRVIDQMFV